MKIYVIGAGGVGGYFGGRLAQKGHDVTFFDRGEHYVAIKQDGLRVRSVKGDFSVTPAKIIQKYSEIKQPDIILIATKTYSNEEVIKGLLPYLKPTTTIVTVQNGIVNDLAMKRIAGKNLQIFPGLAFIISRKSANGVISHDGGLGKIVFGSRNGSRPDALVFLEKIFKESGVDATLSDNIERDLWKKYIFISAFSGITAVTRSPIGDIVKNKRMLVLYEKCVQEAAELARLLGIDLPATIFEDVMQLTVNTVATAKSSLLHDIEAGKKTEVETLSGTLVHLAQNNNLDVPINEMIYAIVSLWDNTH